MRPALVYGSVAVAAILAGCSSDQMTSTNGRAIHLTASQVHTLVSRVAQITPSHPDIAWLADSISVVLKAGAEADAIDVTTDLGAGPYYAVGLQRAMSNGAFNLATFDIIAFDDPSDPTDFIIVDGYVSGSGPDPAQSISGSFDGSSGSGGVTGQLFRVSGDSLYAWRADEGTATLSTGTTGGACVDFQAAAGVTCTQAALKASFAITAADPDAGTPSTDPKTATLQESSVAGILLRFLVR